MSYSEVQSQLVEDTRFRARIVYDPEPANPRKEYDQIGTMWCWHNRYNLGDEQPDFDPSEFWRELARETPEFDNDCPHCELGYELDPEGNRSGICPHCEGTGELAIPECQRIAEQYFVVLPLFLYDHSGITISTGSFSCPWDSGQVGYIFLDRRKALKEGLTHKEQMTKCLESEVEAYDNYLTGQIYGYILDKVDDEGEVIEDHVDSCWGFDDDDYCLTEAVNVARYMEKDLRRKEDTEQQEAQYWAERDVVTR